MRVRTAALATAAATSLAFAAVAFATVTPTLKYTPPTIKVRDHSLHMTSENILIGRENDNFFFQSATGMSIDPASDNGCSHDMGAIVCDRKGVKKIVVLTNDMNDTVEIDLGPSADKVKQIIKGQDDNDDLFGGAGSQKLVGGEGNDELEGGPGRDILLGGPGIDFCVGGPGVDTIKDCEPAPMR
jgi:RTX calcium-binding nonapeptide repeat (4 copies)